MPRRSDVPRVGSSPDESLPACRRHGCCPLVCGCHRRRVAQPRAARHRAGRRSARRPVRAGPQLRGGRGRAGARHGARDRSRGGAGAYSQRAASGRGAAARVYSAPAPGNSSRSQTPSSSSIEAETRRATAVSDSRARVSSRLSVLERMNRPIWRRSWPRSTAPGPTRRCSLRRRSRERDLRVPSPGHEPRVEVVRVTE
jgi:hypothetical protein